MSIIICPQYILQYERVYYDIIDVDFNSCNTYYNYMNLCFTMIY